MNWKTHLLSPFHKGLKGKIKFYQLIKALTLLKKVKWLIIKKKLIKMKGMRCSKAILMKKKILN